VNELPVDHSNAFHRQTRLKSRRPDGSFAIYDFVSVCYLSKPREMKSFRSAILPGHEKKKKAVYLKYLFVSIRVPS